MFVDRIITLDVINNLYESIEDENAKQILSGFAYIIENLPTASDAISRQNLTNLIDAGIEYAQSDLEGDFAHGMQKGFQIIKEIINENEKPEFISTFLSDHMDRCKACSYPLGEGFNYCPICSTPK